MLFKITGKYSMKNFAIFLLVFSVITASAQTNGGILDNDSVTLSALNKQFIQNFLRQDVAAHIQLIHPNFVCIESGGKVVNREEYLKNWASDFDRSGYQSFDYTDEFIRIFHNMALVRAKTVYTKSVDGKTVKGYTMYTDTYVKENGQWKCVQAQLTPVK
jgi:ketosteroid isomerase-like protein